MTAKDMPDKDAKLNSDSFLSKIGRMLGNVARKSPNYLKEFKRMCEDNGVNPSQRMLDLIAFDLEQSGREIQKAKPEEKKAENPAEQITTAQAISELCSTMTTVVKTMTENNIKDKLDTNNQIMALSDQLKGNAVVQLQDVYAEIKKKHQAG